TLAFAGSTHGDLVTWRKYRYIYGRANLGGVCGALFFKVAECFAFGVTKLWLGDARGLCLDSSELYRLVAIFLCCLHLGDEVRCGVNNGSGKGPTLVG